MRKYERVWLSPEAKREAKKRAAEEGMHMADYLDKTLLGKKRNRRGGFDTFF